MSNELKQKLIDLYPILCKHRPTANDLQLINEFHKLYYGSPSSNLYCCGGETISRLKKLYFKNVDQNK